MRGQSNMNDVTIRAVKGKMPKRYPGNSWTVIIQGPTEAAVKVSISSLDEAALQRDMDPCEILTLEPDPNGGYRAVVSFHNFNPITWASEKLHRAEYGAREGWETGKQKAAIKHRVGRRAELERAPVEEALVQKRRDINLAAQGAAVYGAGQEKVAGELKLAAIREKTKYEAAIEAAKAQPQNSYTNLGKEIYD